MVRIGVKIQDPTHLGVSLQQLANAVKRPEALYKQAGRALANELRRHFASMHRRQPNKLGGPRTGFWLQVRESTVDDATGTGATVTVADPRFAQKVYGGPIVAKNRRYLTIPLIPEAHGRRASVFEQETGQQLFPLASKSVGVLVLAYRAPDGVPKAAYLLKRRVLQLPEPEALPPVKTLEEVVIRAGERYVEREGK